MNHCGRDLVPYLLCWRGPSQQSSKYSGSASTKVLDVIFLFIINLWAKRALDAVFVDQKLAGHPRFPVQHFNDTCFSSFLILERSEFLFVSRFNWIICYKNFCVFVRDTCGDWLWGKKGVVKSLYDTRTRDLWKQPVSLARDSNHCWWWLSIMTVMDRPDRNCWAEPLNWIMLRRILKYSALREHLKRHERTWHILIVV